MKNNFNGLKFEKSWEGFKNGRKLLLGHLDGNFTRQTVLRETEKLAKSLRKEGRNIHIGVSAHYEYPDAWTPALMFDVKGPIRFYHPDDSDTTREFADIDALYFYIIETEEKDLKQKVYTKKKETNMFLDHKKKKK